MGNMNHKVPLEEPGTVMLPLEANTEAVLVALNPTPPPKDYAPSKQRGPPDIEHTPTTSLSSTPSSHIIDNNRIITKDTVEAKPPISDDIDLNINDDKTNIQQRQSARQQQQKQRSTTSPLLPLPHKLKFPLTTTFFLEIPFVHVFPSA